MSVYWRFALFMAFGVGMGFPSRVRADVAADATPAPNFIIIFTDDQGYNDLGCFGSETIRTPNIDQMAREGRKFTSFYVPSPVCSPSRAALLTGCYPKRISMEEHVIFPPHDKGLHPDEVTIAELLKGAGYATACVGKWHLGHRKPFLPTRQGFDSYFGIPYSNDMKHPDNRGKPRLSMDKTWLRQDEAFERWGTPLMQDEEIVELPVNQRTVTRRYTDQAIEFITANRKNPFFLYLAHSMPHVPLFVPEDAYDPDPQNAYRAVIEHIDAEVGRIMKTVRDLGLGENTYVIFTSDNGPALHFKNHGGSAKPLRKGKGTTYEGGQRVPCVVWGPGRIPAGTETDELASTLDLFPTLAALAGVEIDSRGAIDGLDISGVLKGTEPSPRDEFLYYSSRGVLEGLRQGEWKLRVQAQGKAKAARGRPELYHLAADIGEQRNLADKMPGKVTAMNERMNALDEEITRARRSRGMLEDADAPLRTEDIRIRDPFIYADPASQTYYMYAQTGNRQGSGLTGVEVYTSTDLRRWQAPQPVLSLPDDAGIKWVWAPEVHKYNDAFYLLVTLTLDETLSDRKPVDREGWPPMHVRGTHVYRADGPAGLFRPLKDGSHTPAEWMALDGTLHLEEGMPYMVFCHEWVQMVDGTIDVVQLSEDLADAVGEPSVLFRASNAPGVSTVEGEGNVTDGCFLYRSPESGRLFMIWSTFLPGSGYCVLSTESESGKITGPWVNQNPIYRNNGGHGMVFRSFDGRLLMALHQPNGGERERLRLLEIIDDGRSLKVRETRGPVIGHLETRDEVITGGSAPGRTPSELWGADGEKWSPRGRLPDFSFAGYHCGEDPLPVVKAVADVTDFGAKGDGKTDSTQAFIKAVEATEEGAITIPAGRYVVSDIVWIKKPGIVLRGAGPGKTILYCPEVLEDVRPNMGETTSGKPTSNYSWSGGFLWAKGSIRRGHLAAIVGDCPRGSREVRIEDTGNPLVPGRRVTIEMKDDAKKTLLSHMYSGDPGDTAKITKPVVIRMVNRIVAVDGSRVTLERPLRLDVRSSWSPRLKTYEPTVREVGIEDLTIEFPVKPYPGHDFTERGMNGIAMNGVADCWVRNVQISNGDSGIYLSGDFCTADGIVLDSRRPEGRGTTGHHGISLGQDCLVRNFDFRTHFVHDITLSYRCNGNVVKNGKGINLSLDHHKYGPHENLFCNIDVGKGNEIWRCGGGHALGKHCGARGTFWGIMSEVDIVWPPPQFGPDSMNLVGVKTSKSSTTDPDGRWFEAISPEALEPADLHAAQLARRLGKTPDAP